MTMSDKIGNKGDIISYLESEIEQLKKENKRLIEAIDIDYIYNAIYEMGGYVDKKEIGAVVGVIKLAIQKALQQDKQE